MSNWFYHGIKDYYDPNASVLKMLEIIESGGIKSRRLQGKTSFYGFNGDDYISICERKNSDEYSKYSNNAFFNYILFRFCFIISRDIPAVPVRYIDCEKFVSFQEATEYMSHYPDVRFSDMFDEWQVKGEIPLSDIIGIGLPMHKILDYYKHGTEKEMFHHNLTKLYILAESLNWPIIDTDTLYLDNDYEKNFTTDEKDRKKYYKS